MAVQTIGLQTRSSCTEECSKSPLFYESMLRGYTLHNPYLKELTGRRFILQQFNMQWYIASVFFIQIRTESEKIRRQVTKEAHNFILDTTENAHFSGSKGQDYLK